MSVASVLSGTPAQVATASISTTITTITRTIANVNTSNELWDFAAGYSTPLFPPGSNVWFTISVPGTGQFGSGFVNWDGTTLNDAGVGKTLSASLIVGELTALDNTTGGKIRVTTSSPVPPTGQVIITLWRI